MKLKYKAKKDNSVLIGKNGTSDDFKPDLVARKVRGLVVRIFSKRKKAKSAGQAISKDFEAKVTLRRGVLKIKTKYPKEVFKFKNPDECDLSVLSNAQMDRANLVINGILKGNGRFFNYSNRRQEKLLNAIPAGFLRYEKTRELFLNNTANRTRTIFDQKMQLLKDYLQNTSSEVSETDEDLLLKENSLKIQEENLFESPDFKFSSKPNEFCITLKTRLEKISYIFEKGSEHLFFEQLSKKDKDNLANMISATLETSLDSPVQTSFQLKNKKAFLSRLPSDFLRYDEVRDAFVEVAGEKYEYIYQNKLDELCSYLKWEKDAKNIAGFDYFNSYCKNENVLAK